MPETLTDTYAIIKTGGKQYRVAPGDELLVERLTGDVDAKIELQTLLTAGGGSDVLARTIGAQLSTQLGQPVVIDNRPGGAQVIAAEAVEEAGFFGRFWLGLKQLVGLA